MTRLLFFNKYVCMWAKNVKCNFFSWLFKNSLIITIGDIVDFSNITIIIYSPTANFQTKITNYITFIMKHFSV